MKDVYQLLLRRMQRRDEALTKADVANILCITPRSANDTLKRMHDLGLVHIARYEITRNKMPVAVFAAGALPDATPPESKHAFVRRSGDENIEAEMERELAAKKRKALAMLPPVPPAMPSLVEQIGEFIDAMVKGTCKRGRV